MRVLKSTRVDTERRRRSRSVSLPTLREQGLEATVQPAKHADDPVGYDAAVIGKRRLLLPLDEARYGVCGETALLSPVGQCGGRAAAHWARKLKTPRAGTFVLLPNPKR